MKRLKIAIIPSKNVYSQKSTYSFKSVFSLFINSQFALRTKGINEIFKISLLANYEAIVGIMKNEVFFESEFQNTIKI